MPITIGSLTSRVNVVDRGTGSVNEKELEELVRLVAKRVREMEHKKDDDDGELPERRTDS